MGAVETCDAVLVTTDAAGYAVQVMVDLLAACGPGLSVVDAAAKTLKSEPKLSA